MRRSIVVIALLLGATSGAHAGRMVFHFYDTIRPHGHKRDDAIGEANVRSCIEKVGVQYESASPAYKECMRGLGYKWMYDAPEGRAHHAQSLSRQPRDQSVSGSGTTHLAQ